MTRTRTRSSTRRAAGTTYVETLRITDQESARVVAVHTRSGAVVGAGCLLSNRHILTCDHVLDAALGKRATSDGAVQVRVIGAARELIQEAKIVRRGDPRTPATDLALLEFPKPLTLANPPVEFVAALRHSGKRFSVLGFPSGDVQGRSASGFLHPADAEGLVQMDGSSPELVRGGFSGAPVWSSDVGGFVGLVVSELSDRGVAWCIPSRLLCLFYNNLLVRFRMPPPDRPQINDYGEDDPNLQIFGTISDNGHRKLRTVITWDKEDERYVAKATYKCRKGSPPPRGGYVTFITHPSFTSDEEDAYELFARLDEGKATVEFYPEEGFTLAAVGDAGDTALTLNLSKIREKPPGFK